MIRLNELKHKKGCPTCDGIDPKSCVRCKGRTRMYDWVKVDSGGYEYMPPLLFTTKGLSDE